MPRTRKREDFPAEWDELHRQLEALVVTTVTPKAHAILEQMLALTAVPGRYQRKVDPELTALTYSTITDYCAARARRGGWRYGVRPLKRVPVRSRQQSAEIMFKEGLDAAAVARALGANRAYCAVLRSRWIRGRSR